jgi:hypothetical protein
MNSYAAPAVNNRKYLNKIEIFCHISRGLNATAESLTKMFVSDPAVSMRPRDPNFANDYLDFLGENEAICKTA